MEGKARGVPPSKVEGALQKQRRIVPGEERSLQARPRKKCQPGVD